jgi:hypothetical protein
MAAQAKNIGKTRKNGDDVACADDTHTQLSRDTGTLAFPQSTDAEITTHTDNCQANQHYGDLNESQNRTTIKQEDLWLYSDQKY